MGVILAKFRKEKSTQEVLEQLQEKIDTLETFTVDTQEQKKRFVGNFLAVSIGVYVIAFIIFYFVYFPPTWSERIMYFLPLLIFPIIIILLRYVFTWYFQRKLNKNSKKLTALRAEKKKILEQVMDKETYKVAVNLLARFAEKHTRPSYASTPSTVNQPTLNRSLPLPSATLNQKSNQLALTSTPTTRGGSNIISGGSTSNTPRLTAQYGTTQGSTALVAQSSGNNQLVRRRTPFPVVNQQDKGVFDRIVDVLIGDGPQDRFAMICKECFSHNGMALKEDFEYTTFRCAFCNALNPSRKQKPIAPRLSSLPLAPAPVNSDSSDTEDDKDDSDDEPPKTLAAANTTQFSTPLIAAAAPNHPNAAALSTSSSDEDEKPQERQNKEEPTHQNPETQSTDELNIESNNTDKIEGDKSLEELLKQLETSDSAIDDTTMSPEEN